MQNEEYNLAALSVASLVIPPITLVVLVRFQFLFKGSILSGAAANKILLTDLSIIGAIISRKVPGNDVDSLITNEPDFAYLETVFDASIT